MLSLMTSHESSSLIIALGLNLCHKVLSSWETNANFHVSTIHFDLLMCSCLERMCKVLIFTHFWSWALNPSHGYDAYGLFLVFISCKVLKVVTFLSFWLILWPISHFYEHIYHKVAFLSVIDGLLKNWPWGSGFRT